MYWSKSTAAFAALSAFGVVVVNAAPSSIDMAKRDTTSQLSQLGISSGCQSTLTNLISSPAATCLNLPGTLAIFSTVSNSSWIPPINNWLTNFCEADPCTSDQLTSTITTAADGCATELSQIGYTTDQLVQEAVDNFTIIKEAACLRDTANGDGLCAITTLNALQTALGGQPLTPAVIEANYALLLANNYALAKQIACTPCASAAFAILRPVIPQDLMSTVDSFVGDQCGVDFTSTPTSGIVVATGSDAVRAAQATASASTSASTQLEVTGGLFVGTLTVALSVLASFF